MNSFLSLSSTVHLLTALTAIMTGSYILFTKKGTWKHRLAGRIYAVSMIVLLYTAFQLYNLFGRFGIVHWGAVGSTLSLLVGLGAVSLRTYIRSWLRWHYVGMGLSITGLYSSFVVESTYRFFAPAYFWWITLGFTGLVFSGGIWVIYRHFPSGPRQSPPSSCSKADVKIYNQKNKANGTLIGAIIKIRTGFAKYN